MGIYKGSHASTILGPNGPNPNPHPSISVAQKKPVKAAVKIISASIGIWAGLSRSDPLGPNLYSATLPMETTYNHAHFHIAFLPPLEGLPPHDSRWDWNAFAQGMMDPLRYGSKS